MPRRQIPPPCIQQEAVKPPLPEPARRSAGPARTRGIEIDAYDSLPWIGLHHKHEFLLHHRHELLELNGEGHPHMARHSSDGDTE